MFEIPDLRNRATLLTLEDLNFPREAAAKLGCPLVVWVFSSIFSPGISSFLSFLFFLLLCFSCDSSSKFFWFLGGRLTNMQIHKLNMNFDIFLSVVAPICLLIDTLGVSRGSGCLF